MRFYRAPLPLPGTTLDYLAGVVRRHCRKIGSCWRKLNPGKQALLVLVHLRRRDLRRPGGRRGHTPVVRVTGAHNTRISLAALIVTKPRCRPRLIYQVHHGRGHSKDRRKSFTEADYARLLDVAHRQHLPSTASAGRSSATGQCGRQPSIRARQRFMSSSRMTCPR